MSKYASLFNTSSPKTAIAPAQEVRGGRLQGSEKAVYTLLFVDDEPGVLRALQRIFLEENYRILTAPSAAEALKVLESETVHLVITDHRMPAMTGAQLLKELKQRWPATIRIMLTGYADVQSIMGAVNEGAVYKFITKPWNDEDLRLTVSLALQQYELIKENRKLKEITQTQQVKIRNYAALVTGNRRAMGNILIKAGLIRAEDLARAQKAQQDKEYLTETLARLGLATEAKIVRVLGEHLKVQAIDLREMNLAPGIVKFLPQSFCEKNRLIPVALDKRHITVAMADPSDMPMCDNLEFMTGLKVKPLVAGSGEILRQLKAAYGESREDKFAGADEVSEIEPLEEIDIIIEEEEADLNIQELIGSSEVPPIIRIVNAVISEAIRYRASDIHIEPKTKYSVVRYRIDGILHSKIKIPPELHNSTVSRIKILARMDISERRRPQDGRITVKSGTRIVDIRVSSMPTSF